MTRSLTVLVLLSLSFGGDALARGRAVRSAALCSYGLVPRFATTVAAEGLSHGSIEVTGVPLAGTTAACTSWNAWSLASWVTVLRSGDVAYVDVAPNPTSTARTATVLIAGVPLDLHQDAAAVISPPVDPNNVLKNPGFDRDLTSWGWYERFPNGQGNATWSTFDANNNPASGSIRLLNTVSGHTFQQLQCAAVDAGQVYEYGGKFFATSSSAGTAMWTVYEYAVPDCSDDKQAVGYETKTPRIRTPGTWQLESYTKRMGASTQSALVVIGSRSTSTSSFEIYMDDLFLRKP